MLRFIHWPTDIFILFFNACPMHTNFPDCPVGYSVYVVVVYIFFNIYLFVKNAVIVLKNQEVVI